VFRISASNRNMKQRAGENRMVRIFIAVLFSKYYYDDKIDDDEIGGACGEYGKGDSRKIVLETPAGRMPSKAKV
jgi:hypothetical protein